MADFTLHDMTGNIATQTFEDFARALFEFEYCAECGGDWYDHEPWGVLGNWFAHCKVGTFCFIADGPGVTA